MRCASRVSLLEVLGGRLELRQGVGHRHGNWAHVRRGRIAACAESICVCEAGRAGIVDVRFDVLKLLPLLRLLGQEAILDKPSTNYLRSLLRRLSRPAVALGVRAKAMMQVLDLEELLGCFVVDHSHLLFTDEAICAWMVLKSVIGLLGAVDLALRGLELHLAWCSLGGLRAVEEATVALASLVCLALREVGDRGRQLDGACSIAFLRLLVLFVLELPLLPLELVDFVHELLYLVLLLHSNHF